MRSGWTWSGITAVLGLRFSSQAGRAGGDSDTEVYGEYCGGVFDGGKQSRVR